MQLVPIVREAAAVAAPFPLDRRLFVTALGIVPTSGWSGAGLAPVYYVRPPDDGIWDFHFRADPPHGPVLDVEVPVAAATFQPCPDWVRGVRIHAGTNQMTVVLKGDASLRLADSPALAAREATNIVYSDVIAVYDDSFQPTGFCGGFPPHVRMKKLRHELTLTVEGPDGDRIRRCVEEAAVAGLIAAIVAAFLTGGAALPAAIAAATERLESCLGSSFSVRFDNRSHWIEWCT